MIDTGYFSVLRWRSDPTRDEARNVAVILVDEAGRIGGVRAAPISSISPTLHEQGLLDEVVASLERRMASPEKLRLADLVAIRDQLQRSLYLTEPRPVAVSDTELTLGALYRAYARPRQAGGHGITKGRVLDRVVSTLRVRGWQVHRAQRLHDILFDIVVEAPEAAVGSVLSFASAAHDFAAVERDAGHFLYGLDRTGRPGFAYIQSPREDALQPARDAHGRVSSWYREANVDVKSPDELAARPEQETLALTFG